MEKRDATLKEYTWQEIRQHNNQDSLWIVIYGRVYDHPGPDVFEHIAGHDATDEFENMGHTRNGKPMVNW